jgi:carboxynorspermidine decarboxylase
MKLIYKDIPSPCYVLEEQKLIENLNILNDIQIKTGAKIICALKGFSFWQSFGLVSKYLPGATASSLWEAKLAQEEMNGEVHVYAPAYLPEEIDELLDIAKHISFNSTTQWLKYKSKALASSASSGIRVNPECSTVETDLYNPCMPGSRLGALDLDLDKLSESEFEGVEGLHFHALCEQDSTDLKKVLTSFEEKFSKYFSKIKWVNFGGGHHITRKDYDRGHLIKILNQFKERFPKLEIILEPGEAIGWQTGFLLSTVLDITENQGFNAILDVSFSAHMPDCLEMPYRPDVRDAAPKGTLKYDYRLGGGTCLSGDFLDDFSFEKKLAIGERLIFEDMIHYTMVKTSFFNGVKHPSIGVIKEHGDFQILRQFDYSDYKKRLG